jgi:UDP-N-acetylmuramoylalanine--D-glutamate ligase
LLTTRAASTIDARDRKTNIKREIANNMNPHSSVPTEPHLSLRGKRVTVMGLGRHGGGVAVTRWLAQLGCQVTVTDLDASQQLTHSLAQLGDLPIQRFRLGRHDRADFLKTHMVIVNPAVKPNHPLVELARSRGATVTSEIELFLEHCPATVVGITGTTGKSTTSTILAEILRNAGRCTWLGGNIGVSLLTEMQYMHAADVVVLELSSFQLANLSRNAKLPSIAVITNCSPNHLDWHPSWHAYVAAKQRLLAADVGKLAVVLNLLDREVATWCELTAGEIVPLIDDQPLQSLKLHGEHNRQNARLAATAARRLGADDHAIQSALATFEGLTHRLELVRTVAGRRFYDDSKATSIAATTAALTAIDGPIWLLAGGVDQQLSWQGLAKQICAKAKGAALFGQSRNVIASAIRSIDKNLPLFVVEHLPAAVAWAFEISKPSDAILLSPACQSFDQFSDFTQRGRIFCELVHALTNTDYRGSNLPG